MGQDRKQVSRYLMLMKCYARNEFTISPRNKNHEFLLECGIDFETARDIVMSLQVADYSAGPCSNDKHLPGRNDVWVFGKRLSFNDEEVEAYIKIVVSKAKNGLGCLCVSFHESEHGLRYEFGGDGREIYILPPM